MALSDPGDMTRPVLATRLPTSGHAQASRLGTTTTSHSESMALCDAGEIATTANATRQLTLELA
jgi:hypothetical protein